ncbi:MAG: GNAT family N-acetyltransferase [Alphaproteobacteria bacterium]|nr:GNAT family N-acetyltransferase [Alphaproteobacteria bacterium]
MKPLVRPARVADAAAIARIYVDGWRDAYPGLLPDKVLLDMTEERQAIAWAATIAKDRGRGLVRVATLDGRVAGFGSAGRSRFTALPYGSELYTLYVEREARDHGLGRALVRELFATLARLGHGSAMVWVLSGNPARHFYASLGGRLVAEWTERQWGAEVRQAAYGWSDIAALSAPRAR